MSSQTRIATLLKLLLIVVVGCLLPVGAAAEQASQPASAAAGGLDVGRYHSCALLPSAGVRCWGYGADGSLGYGNRATIGDDETPAAAGPVELGAGRTGVALSAGDFHTCALLDDGAVRCWGFGGDGRLGTASNAAIGDDETPASLSPVDIGGRAQAITAGGNHSCAILDDGNVRCWGFGLDGQLGYGNADYIGDNEAPSAVAPVKLGAGRTARAITAGRLHTCALLDDQTVRCWGANGNGQLGYGTRESVGENETPDAVGPVELGRPAVALSAGGFHTCALLDDGTVRCWGSGRDGRLGYGNTTSIGDETGETPDTVGPVDLGRRAVAISAGAEHTCAVLDGGEVRCWGVGGNDVGGYGRLGYAVSDPNDPRFNVGDNETPAAIGPVDLGSGRRATAISAGDNGTCVRLDDGSVRCWGNGENGRLGSCNLTTIGDDESPASAGPVDLGVPGSPSAGCATTPPTPPSGNAPPGPAPAPGPDPGTPPPGSTPPSPTPDDGLAAQRTRATALKNCLNQVARRALSERRRARRLSSSTRNRTLRQITRRTANRRGNCLKRHGRTPGRITTLDARATGRRSIQLNFRATGTQASKPPPPAATSSNNHANPSAPPATSAAPAPSAKAPAPSTSPKSAKKPPSTSPTCAPAPPTTTPSPHATTSPDAPDHAPKPSSNAPADQETAIVSAA